MMRVDGKGAAYRNWALAGLAVHRIVHQTIMDRRWAGDELDTARPTVLEASKLLSWPEI